nr:beta-amylase 8 isoform X3 [Aegilops tauschii subsp. strangulata]
MFGFCLLELSTSRMIMSSLENIVKVLISQEMIRIATITHSCSYLQQGAFQATSLETPVFTNSLNSYAIGTPLDSQASALQTDDSLSPSSLDSVVVAEQSIKNESYGNSSSANSLNCMGSDQPNFSFGLSDLANQIGIKLGDNLSFSFIVQLEQLLRASAVCAGDFTKTPYIPVYASLSMGIINCYCQLVDPEAVRAELRHLKSLNVDGVVVDCWWGIVEAWTPQKYEWSGYRDLFGIIKEFKLKVQVYFDFMRSFHMEFRSLSEEGLISAIEVGLGASGELRYPSCPEKMGWRYPGIGEFQCYDRYMQKNLRQSALARGHLFWARGPDNAGYYNSRSHETGFFCDGGDYDSYYGRFFLNWYSGILIDHVDQVLSLATLAFDGAAIVVKIPSIYWWHRTASHAAELTAGFYNPTNRDGYSPVFRMLKKHSIILKVVCYGPEFTVQENDEAFADPEGLTWQVMNAAWDHGLSVSVESALPCLDVDMYSRILDTAKPRNDPDRHHLSFFAYRQRTPFLLQRDVCFSELETFVKCMHGEATQNFVD